MDRLEELQQKIDLVWAILTYVGPLNEYEHAALYALGKGPDSPEPYPLSTVQQLLKDEPWID